MGFTKYSLCETYCQGSSEISFIHLNIDDLFYKYYSPVIEHQYTFEIVESFLEKNCLLDLSGATTGRSGDLLGAKRYLLS